MHPIHKAFASEPALPMTLAKLFEVLDGIDPQKRWTWISQAMGDIMHVAEFRTGARDYETGYEQIYQQFKIKCGQMNGVIYHQFLAYSIVARSLAWLCVGTRRVHLEQVLENQRQEIAKAREALAAGRLSKQKHDDIVRDCEERLNNVPSDQTLMESEYAEFCEVVVKPFLYYPLDEE